MIIDASLYLLASFVLGTIIGSFANVFVLRYGTGRSLGGRSSCGSCGKTLSWYELIPVVSWLIQWGRCRSCESRISPQYLIAELVFGFVFMAAAYTVFSGASCQLPAASFVSLYPCILELIYLWLVSFLFISLSIYDIKHMIIPDGMLVALGIVVVVWNIVLPVVGYQLPGSSHPDILMSLISGPLVALPFFALWFVSKGRWMGLGDIKLAVVIGWMLGLLGGFSALVFGVWAGALISLLIVGITRLVSHRAGLTMKSEIPFGPFLAAGALFVLLTGSTILDLIL